LREEQAKIQPLCSKAVTVQQSVFLEFRSKKGN